MRLMNKTPKSPLKSEGFFIFEIYRRAWTDGFRTIHWGELFPVPDLALKEMRELLTLTAS
mgnify:CR=1 FL=1